MDDEELREDIAMIRKYAGFLVFVVALLALGVGLALVGVITIEVQAAR